MSSLMNNQNTPESIRAALKEIQPEQGGRALWRSLEELSRREDFGELLVEQTPGLAAEWDPVNRRDFLRLMGASLALGGLTSCTRQPREKIIPYVDPPENVVPGKPLFFATAIPVDGYGVGVLAESHMGRPTKLDGNELHPSSRGGTDAYLQAAILNLYDPDRAQTIQQRGRPSEWNGFVQAVSAALTAAPGGDGVRILSGNTSSPALIALMEEFLAAYPKAQWHTFDPINRDALYAGTQLAYGKSLDPVYAFDRADVVLALDADFMAQGPGHLRYARDFASRRDVGQGAMNRLYAVESSVTVTGASADHRYAMTPDRVEAFARAVAAELGLSVQADASGLDEALVHAVAEDLKAHPGKALVVVGEHRSPELQALAFAMNEALGARGATLELVPSALARPGNSMTSLAALSKDMLDGKVSLLVMLDSNPVYHAPAELPFSEALRKVALVVHQGHAEDESARLSHWNIPSTHALEAWGDVKAHDGSVSIIQPLIEPLYAGKSALEVMSALLGRPEATTYDVVHDHWLAQLGDAGEKAWRRAVHDGVLKDAAPAPATDPLVWTDTGSGEAAVDHGAIDLSILPDPGLHDGAYANNGWLQELPKPHTTLTWDNALLISEETASALGIRTGDTVEVGGDAGQVTVPVLVTVGIPQGGAVLHLGHGRKAAGRIGNDIGVAIQVLQRVTSPYRAAVSVTKTGSGHEFALTQTSHTMAGRHHVRAGTVADYHENPRFVDRFDEFKGKPVPSIYPTFDFTKRPQWGMVIDLSTCIGCNACVTACQAENNTPVVGKDQVARGRELHWIRIDRYYEGNAANAEVHHQPVTCMHCENAPCEAVCPVGATVHSRDGINQMVYNRCVGTRYCSNNCPYKVRRFNFYKFADHTTPSLKLQRNPDVTVRSRGVMEKCTFCIQRISEARIKARLKDRPIADGAVITACQQACPTQAITFGDLLDPESAVARKAASPLKYSLLKELSTEPRVTYLAKVRNPNPALKAAGAIMEAHGHGG